MVWYSCDTLMWITRWIGRHSSCSEHWVIQYWAMTPYGPSSPDCPMTSRANVLLCHQTFYDLVNVYQEAIRSITESIVTSWSALKSGHPWTCAEFAQTPEKCEWFECNAWKLYLVREPAICLCLLFILWIEESATAADEVTILVNGLILQSGGLERSLPLRKLTSWRLSDMKLTLESSKWVERVVAKAKVTVSAISTEEVACIAALMNMVNGGWTCVLTKKHQVLPVEEQ